MNTQKLDGHNIYHLFISGAINLIHSEHNLNRINVFPVADGDTGTNLALTMKSIVSKAVKHHNAYQSLSSISSIAIENAYGNSGMIFAQFLNGFAVESKGKDNLTILDFIDLASKASLYAYEAVASPKEGTILSVMKEWSNYLKNSLNILSFEKLFEGSVNKVKSLVEQTKYQLKVLLDNNVVDAGAKGFLIFLEGILVFIKSGKSEHIPKIETIEFEEHINILTNLEVLENRYCSQFYIETQKLSSQLKKELEGYGDSLIVIGTSNHLHIHIHTDYPEKVMAYLINEDIILTHKIEDMKVKSSIVNNRKHSIGLITDSIADIPKSFIDDEQITVIPVNLICDSVVYLDKLSMTPKQFYEKMNGYKKIPTSAQPTSSLLERAYLDLLEHYDSIIGIFVSKNMSGTFDTAKRVAERIENSDKKITIIDSMLNSSAEGLLVMEAANLIANGLTHDEVVEQINKKKKQINIYVSIKSLSSVLRGGRISKAKGFILSMANLKPVISIDENGKGIVYKKTFSQQSAVVSILKKIKQDIEKVGIEKYSLVYADNINDINTLKDSLISLTGMQPVFVETISPVVGLNAGLGAFAVSYIKKG